MEGLGICVLARNLGMPQAEDASLEAACSECFVTSESEPTYDYDVQCRQNH